MGYGIFVSPISRSGSVAGTWVCVADWLAQRSVIIQTLERGLLRVREILWVYFLERLSCLPLYVISKEVWQSNHFYSFGWHFIVVCCGYLSKARANSSLLPSILNNNNKETKNPKIQMIIGDILPTPEPAGVNKEALWECLSFIKTN